MKKTHQWMLFFLFLFFLFTIGACAKRSEKFVFYQTKETSTLESFRDQSDEEAPQKQEVMTTRSVETLGSIETVAETIAVYLCGEVCNPGVYVLAAGSRLYQAVEMAGGLTNQAKAEAINLARVLSDSEQILIPNVSESVTQSFMQVEVSETSASNVVGKDGAAEDSSEHLININEASVTELMTLSGIGQVKAEAIVAYRESNGPFSSIEEIKNVPGIKEAAFEKIKGMITVF